MSDFVLEESFAGTDLLIAFDISEAKSMVAVATRALYTKQQGLGSVVIVDMLSDPDSGMTMSEAEIYDLVDHTNQFGETGWKTDVGLE